MVSKTFQTTYIIITIFLVKVIASSVEREINRFQTRKQASEDRDCISRPG